MKYLKVTLWGQEIGRLVWDSATRRTYFTYNPELKDRIPDIAPLISPAKNRNFLFMGHKTKRLMLRSVGFDETR